MEGGGKKGEGLGGWEAVGRHVESITRYAYQKVCLLVIRVMCVGGGVYRYGFNPFFPFSLPSLPPDEISSPLQWKKCMCHIWFP